MTAPERARICYLCGRALPDRTYAYTREGDGRRRYYCRAYKRCADKRAGDSPPSAPASRRGEHFRGAANPAKINPANNARAVPWPSVVLARALSLAAPDLPFVYIAEAANIHPAKLSGILACRTYVIPAPPGTRPRVYVTEAHRARAWQIARDALAEHAAEIATLTADLYERWEDPEYVPIHSQRVAANKHAAKLRDQAHARDLAVRQQWTARAAREATWNDPEAAAQATAERRRVHLAAMEIGPVWKAAHVPYQRAYRRIAGANGATPERKAAARAAGRAAAMAYRMAAAG